jgi:tungstate transport system permease protein
MSYASDGLSEALRLLFAGDVEVWSAVWISVKCALLSTAVATLVGLPIGFLTATGRFRGRRAAIVLLNTLMGLPTVVVGLVIYGMLSRRGPLGRWGLLYTPAAMVIGQVVLATPIVAALTSAAARGLDPRVLKTAYALGAGAWQAARTSARELGPALSAAVVAGFGRVFAEVGVSLMLGGNIRFYTRNITTTIALETSKGEFATGLALGLVLLVVAFVVNLVFHVLKGSG